MEAPFIIEKLSWIDKVAGGVWIGLSIILIWVLTILYREEGPEGRTFLTGVALLVFVWLYPLYTSFFSNVLIGEIGNIATLIFTLFFLFQLKRKYRNLAKWMIPQSVWLSVATCYVGLMIIS
ncbi:MAG: hypothetical protein AAF824_07195 [Bacteroidota bacterium]